MQYSVRSTGKAEYLYFEEEAVKHIRPSGTGVELRLQYHHNYVGNAAYKYDQLRNQFVLTLTKGQAIAVVEQDRKEQSGFCEGCYDHGKGDAKGCVRCELLESLKRAGAGDLRQKPSEMPLNDTHRGNGLVWAVIILLCLWWWTLAQWASASAEVEQLQKQVERVKQ